MGNHGTSRSGGLSGLGRVSPREECELPVRARGEVEGIDRLGNRHPRLIFQAGGPVFEAPCEVGGNEGRNQVGDLTGGGYRVAPSASSKLGNSVRRRERIGGLLNYYYREAA